jgi:hypothetical protein
MAAIQIVLITGNSESGKTTAAKRLKTMLESSRQNVPHESVHILSFSHALKVFTAEILNKIYSPPDLFDAEKMDDSNYKTKTHDYEFSGKPLTVRNALITFGMTMRTIDPNVWINAMVHTMKGILEQNEYTIPMTFIVMDNRFLNETEYYYSISSFEGLDVSVHGLHVTRDNSKELHNENEIATLSELFSYEQIDNNGTLEALDERLANTDAYKKITNSKPHCPFDFKNLLLD